MSELQDLYQEVIIDHNREPRNYGALCPCDASQQGVNPLCGDELTVYARFEGDRVVALQFEGKGCAICTASASLMTEAIRGKTREQALAFFEKVHHMLISGENLEDLGKLAVLAGVSEFPTRVKCASLAWHALRGLLMGEANQVTTE